MKKFFAFAMVLMVLVTALGFNVGSVGATGRIPINPAPKVFLNSPYFNDLGVGTQVSAQMLANSNFKNVHCIVKAAGQVRCEIPKKFAGQSVTLYLTVGDQTLIFYVIVPNLKEVKSPV